MDIDLLSKMVKELILDNDRVVLPGLGAFVAEIVPSTFSDKGYTINPPYRRMYFRSKPNEGKELAELYARGNKVELAVAERIITDFITELKSILFTRKAVAFPGLGRLRATKENNVFFVADEDLDIYPAGFGLEPISLKTHMETREEVIAAVEGLKSMLMERQAANMQVPEVKPEQTSAPVVVKEEVPVPEILPEVLPEPETAVPEVLPEPEPPVRELHRNLPAEEAVAPTVKILPVREKSNVKKVLFIISGVIIAVVLLLLAALAVLGRTNPEWIDRLLYTPEELKILNQIL